MKTIRRRITSIALATIMSVLLALLFLSAASQGFGFSDIDTYYGEQEDQLWTDYNSHGAYHDDSATSLTPPVDSGFYVPGRGIRRDGYGNPRLRIDPPQRIPSYREDAQSRRLSDAFEDRLLWENLIGDDLR